MLTSVGSEPLTALVLTISKGERLVLNVPAGSDARALQNVLGLELTVWGTATGERSAAAGPQPLPVFSIRTFVVRSADGHAAYDGVVSRTDNVFVLLLADGSRVGVPWLPRTLQQKIGARVYVAGPLDAPPISYGVISANQPPD